MDRIEYIKYIKYKKKYLKLRNKNQIGSSNDYVMYNNLIKKNISFLKNSLNCKLYTDKFIISDKRKFDSKPDDGSTIDIVEVYHNDYKFYCSKIINTLRNMDYIGDRKFDILDSFRTILEKDNKTEINLYILKEGVSVITDEEELYIGDDILFYKIYSFVKLYYTLLKSNDYDKDYNYFYLTDRKHYIDVLKLTIYYRKKIENDYNFQVPRYLKIAAIFHDIERYNKNTQYESLSYMGQKYDKIRKKILHPLNTIAIINILYKNISDNLVNNTLKEDLIIASDIIRYHDIPLTDDGLCQESIEYPHTSEVILYGLNKNNNLFNDLKALITADSIALFRNTYPFFILYIKNKSGDDWVNSILDRLTTSLKKVPLEYRDDIKSYITKSIDEFKLNNQKFATSENLGIIKIITDQIILKIEN